MADDDLNDYSHRQIVDILQARSNQIHDDHLKALDKVHDRISDVAAGLVEMREESLRASHRLEHIEREQKVARRERSSLGDRLTELHNSIAKRLNALEVPITGAKAVIAFFGVVLATAGAIAGLGYTVLQFIKHFRGV